LAVGWRAAARGLRVVVLEREHPGRATSWVAAGMLAPVTEASPIEQPLMALGLASAALYPRFTAELEASSGMASGYLACGTLVVARDGDEAEALERELEMRRGLGLAVRRLRPSEVRGLEPALAPHIRLGLEADDDHAVDPRRLTAALSAALQATGGELRSGARVEEVERAASGRVCGVRLAGGERIAANQVVIAAGAWSDSVQGLPEDARVPVHPVKGQILRLRDPAGPGLLTHVLRMSDGYVVPRGDGRYVLGATMEERGFDTSVTAAAVFELLRDATELLPGLGELVIDELSAGLRPATPDNAPAIGPCSVPGLLWATGHHRNGILLAPVTADMIVDALLGHEPSELAAAFNPARFHAVAVEA
jgi:glycine oxidase